MKFTDYNFHPKLQDALREMDYVECTPIQEETYKYLVERRDIYAQSQTGTGKTGAFALSGLQVLLEEDKAQNSMLIIAPTRELAVQIEKETANFCKYTKLKTACFYGGVGYSTQKQNIANGIQIIVGTIGRLLDLYKSGDLDLHHIRILVIDEADRMFEMGFINDLQYIFKQVPPKAERITMLYSATLNSKVGNLSWEFLDNPAEIVISPEQVAVDLIEQQIYHVATDEKFKLLLYILKLEPLENALIFTNTKEEASKINIRLQQNGFNSKALIGDLPQKDRLRIYGQLRNRELPIVVATDVASRGLHIDDLSMVINYDLPGDAENYVHRIGRTARAGKSGKAISFACERYIYNLVAIEKYIKNKIPVQAFTMNLTTIIDSSRRNNTTRTNNRSRRNKPRGPVRKQETSSNNKYKPKDRYNRSAKNSIRYKNADERLEYYKKKYGEDFTIKNNTASKGPAQKPQAQRQEDVEKTAPVQEPKLATKKKGFFARLLKR